MNSQWQSNSRATHTSHTSGYEQQALTGRRGAISEQGGRNGGQAGYIYGSLGEYLGTGKEEKK
jgi:hypothetical protein